MAQKVEAQGGRNGGTQFDDGSEHDAVTKIQTAIGTKGIQYVQFEYVKNGQTVEAPLHGVKGRTIAADPFVISHPEEYLVSVEGWYTPGWVIQGLKFKSNKKTSELIGYDDGTPFTLQVQDKKIIGFHGYSGDNLDSLGAYFVPLVTSPPSVPPKKLEAKGGETGAVWDDSHHDNVKKIYVGQGQDGVAAVKFEYTNGSQVVIGVEHGKSTMLGFEEFELESDEYITSVEGTYDKIFGTDSAVVTMLTFKTNKNKTAGPFGLEGSTPFVFKEEGYKITGFHGRAGEAINAIGVYLAPVGSIPLTPATQGKKLEAAGSDGGALWDDGAFEGVRVVSVGQAQDGIGVVKFVYHKGSQIVVGNEHGKTTMLGFEEFQLDYPSEYITAVEGTYDKIFGSDAAVITMLRFKTNKQTAGPFGLEAGTPFVLKEEGYKIVGFHGSAGDLLHKFGVHVLPITN
ncbi:unnamed protein product [Thlaspi arvense]|uniref:Jacalin-type lectin domain-containing protein n=1 Tax=Thlaspi arvense TaxID=13288 RepID=A0AAU9RZX2_THLAR|nr:unnamed protein product [Thlaspi arvense]